MWIEGWTTCFGSTDPGTVLRGEGREGGFIEEVDLSCDLKGQLPFAWEKGGRNAFLVEEGLCTGSKA